MPVNSLGAESIALLRLAWQCAPLFSGIKASNLIVLDPASAAFAGHALDGTDISKYCLFQDNFRIYLFLYDDIRMKTYLSDRENSLFLRRMGYFSIEPTALLKELRDRFSKYKDGYRVFPHEMGLMLNYPLQDVLGFMRHEGENCLYTGYWKVYHDLPGAMSTFNAYERAKSEVLEAVLNGMGIAEIIAAYRKQNHEATMVKEY